MNHVYFALVAFVLVLANSSAVAKDCHEFDVFVLRHLEKDQQDSGSDPSLSQKGKANAKKIGQLKAMHGVQHGFYTPYKRTFETLEFLDIEKSVYDPTEPEALVKTIKTQYCGQAVVIVGHSNTVPAIISAFGGQFTVSYAGESLEKGASIDLSENDYGRIFRVTMHNGRRHQQLYRLTSHPSEGD